MSTPAVRFGQFGPGGTPASASVLIRLCKRAGATEVQP